MLLAKLKGLPFESEVPAPKFKTVAPPPAVPDISKATIALVTDGGLVPVGNPDKFYPGIFSGLGSLQYQGPGTIWKKRIMRSSMAAMTTVTSKQTRIVWCPWMCFEKWSRAG